MNKKDIVKKFQNKGLLSKRVLTPQELTEIREVNRLASARRFEAEQIKGNTALIPDGQKVAEQMEAVARLLENVRDQLVSQRILDCGYPAGAKASLNLQDGTIVEQ